MARSPRRDALACMRTTTRRLASSNCSSVRSEREGSVVAKQSGISPLTIALPQGGGDVRGLGGTFTADFNRGTGSFELPLQLPPGIAGFTPPLALAYSTGASNGAFGLGWSIGPGKIQRDGEQRFLQYDDTDGLLLDGHGSLVPLLDGSYRPA